MRKVTETFTITADENTMVRFKRFLAFMHYNAGHSGVFCMSFDGDGADTLRVNPSESLEQYRKDAQRIGGCGPEFEIAYDDSYWAIRGDYNKNQYKLKDGKLQRYNRETDTYTDIDR